MTSQSLRRVIRNALLILGLGGALAACSGGGGGGGVTVGSTPPPSQDFFGTAFGVDYRASPNSEPVVPAVGDIIPLSLTTEPQPLT